MSETAIYTHPDPENTSERALAARTGQRVDVLSRLDPATYDSEDVGVMYRIRFADGYEDEAFADELTL